MIAGAQRVAQQGHLSVVESVIGAHERFGLADFLHLALQVRVKFVDCSFDDFELVDHEVGRVALVGLGEQVGLGILRRRLAKDARDRKELGQPISVFAHGPVKECASSAAVSVLERVVIAEPIVQEYCADYGVDEVSRRHPTVRECAHGFESLRLSLIHLSEPPRPY